MIGIIRKQLILALFLFVLGLFLTPKTYAASLRSLTDTISTSRPSASASINDNPQAASATEVSVIDNGSFYLASDSAIFQGETGQTQDIINVASMSAQIAGTPPTREISFTAAIPHAHHKWTAVVVPITAKHTITFTTAGGIPANGRIVVTFPTITDQTGGSNLASPSATGFEFNNLANTNITFSGTGLTCSGGAITISAPSITCVTSTPVSGSTVITIVIGSTTPQIINPTRSSNTACSGFPVTCGADYWKVAVKTQDDNTIPNDIDTGSVKIGTIESVQVQATVEPTMTFSIAGLLTSDNYQTVGTSTYCGSETTNTALVTSATSVNLGILTNGSINHAGQKITMSTNGSRGYAITATSSGHLINPANGFFIPDANVGNPAGFNSLSANDTPAPAAITAGTAAFGISPCGIRVPTSSPTWGGINQTVASGALFSNPWNTGTNSYYATIASYSSPSGVTGDITVIRYAGTVAATTPAGLYVTVLTYVATATF